MNTAKAVGSAWFCVGLCLATQRHKNGTQVINLIIFNKVAKRAQLEDEIKKKDLKIILFDFS